MFNGFNRMGAGGIAMRTRKLASVGIVVLVVLLGGVVAFAATGGGSSASGWQMMGGRYVDRPTASTPVGTLTAARSDAQRFASRLGLGVDEVLQFERNFYAKLVDGNGNAATEVLVDPASGRVSIEYGPAMMWNARYRMGATGALMMGTYGAGMMRGDATGNSTSSGADGAGAMMGATGRSSSPTSSAASGAVSLAEAHPLAQRWLASKEPGVKVEPGGDTFPGYYTLETLRDAKITGMISVNATTGAVFPHWWHGAFIAKSR